MLLISSLRSVSCHLSTPLIVSSSLACWSQNSRHKLQVFNMAAAHFWVLIFVSVSYWLKKTTIMNHPEIQQLKTTILYFLEKQLCRGSTDLGWDQQKWFRPTPYVRLPPPGTSSLSQACDSHGNIRGTRR